MTFASLRSWFTITLHVYLVVVGFLCKITLLCSLCRLGSCQNVYVSTGVAKVTLCDPSECFDDHITDFVIFWCIVVWH